MENLEMEEPGSLASSTSQTPGLHGQLATPSPMWLSLSTPGTQGHRADSAEAMLAPGTQGAYGGSGYGQAALQMPTAEAGPPASVACSSYTYAPASSAQPMASLRPRPAGLIVLQSSPPPHARVSTWAQATPLLAAEMHMWSFSQNQPSYPLALLFLLRTKLPEL